jgi:hypothetical protein
MAGNLQNSSSYIFVYKNSNHLTVAARGKGSGCELGVGFLWG